MIKLIIQKEIYTIMRDTRLKVSAIILLLLMVAAVFVGRAGQKQIQADRAKAQNSMYDKWLNQGDKHPHSAAHYGLFAFKPKPVLSFLDSGLDNYTGVSVFLEAHKQNEVLFSSAQDSNGMVRFGELTSALIFQVLIPLLIIFLAFDTFTREREENTLKLISAQGLSMQQLLLGKVAGIYLAVLILFIPIVLLAYMLLNYQTSIFHHQVEVKFLMLIGFYAFYFLIFVLLSTIISAFSKRSGIALLSLLGFWIVTCILLPKGTTNLASKLYPTPSQFEFRNAINDRVKNGINGHNPSDARLAVLKQKVLEEYGVSTIEELPVNWSGIAMQAG